METILIVGVLTGFVAACVGIAVALLFGARPQQPPPPDTFACPACQGLVSRDADRCPHCGREFTR